MSGKVKDLVPPRLEEQIECFASEPEITSEPGKSLRMLSASAAAPGNQVTSRNLIESSICGRDSEIAARRVRPGSGEIDRRQIAPEMCVPGIFGEGLLEKGNRQVVPILRLFQQEQNGFIGQSLGAGVTPIGSFDLSNRGSDVEGGHEEKERLQRGCSPA
jgi:hypothetical protein